ncbi:MAG TPA: ABC transporter permease [bacterium]|nr:ABC transporter permease [bacterium]
MQHPSAGRTTVRYVAAAAQYDIAALDIITGLSDWRMWGRLGWQEIKRRYRRTAIGPFWNTLSLGIFMLALGLVWANLWHQDPKVYLPFLTTGLLAWNLVAAVISEGCQTFLSGESLIKQLRFPYSLLACTVVWRNLIVFFHNFVIFIGVAIFAGLHPKVAMFLTIPGILLVWINGIWFAMMLGMVCTRYRDVQQVVMSILQISMFVTPIFFTPEQLGPKMTKYFANGNPLFHYVDVIRSPLLGKLPSRLTYEFVLLATVVGWAVTLWTYSRFRRRLAYWM